MSLVAIFLVGLALFGLWRRPSRTSEAHFASFLEARELIFGGHEGRIVLGRRATTRWRSTHRVLAAPRDSSVLVLGPTQSGKTSSLVIPALLAWPGPLLAASVKDDLVRATIDWRSRQGPVRVLDPEAPVSMHSATFDPTVGLADAAAARRRAERLCGDAEATPGADSQFWSQLAAKHLAPLLFASSQVEGGLSLVERWVDERNFDEPRGLLMTSAGNEALRWLDASFDRDERQRSSVFATLESILAPLVTEKTRLAINPEEILAARGSLYLCAPAHEQRRHRPLFTAVAGELFDEAFRRARIDGGRLRDPLLVVLDEAAAIAPLGELDVLAATCASHGITLVTCFQDLAQIEARWGSRAPTVINNHTTRVFLSGLADRNSEPVLRALLGSNTRFLGRDEAKERRVLLESHELRRLPAHRGVVVSGRLEPVRVALRPWWRSADLAVRGKSATTRYASHDEGSTSSHRYRRHIDQGNTFRGGREFGTGSTYPPTSESTVSGRFGLRALRGPRRGVLDRGGISWPRGGRSRTFRYQSGPRRKT